MSQNSNEWKRFFDGHAPVYLENCFTQNTEAEIEFLIEELGLAPGASVLDVGCGVGRHAIPLAGLGFRVTGVDISDGMLERARARAAESGVEATWVQADVSRELPEGPFDAALCLCEGAFGLLGSDDDPAEHDLGIIRNVHGALAPGAPFILTVLNAMALIRKSTDEDVAAGRVDTRMLVEHSEMDSSSEDDEGGIRLRERWFVPSELSLMLRIGGFDVEHVWGGTAGKWERGNVMLDEMEIMAVARKRVR